jgi:uncharacterized protein
MKDLTFVISNHCNMDTVANGCSYCCIRNRNTSPFLPVEIIEKTIMDYMDDGIGIIEFFGGEPTIHFEEINYIVNKFPQYKYRMYTNGLFEFDIWKDLLDGFYEVCISIDGYGSFNSKRGIGNNAFITNKTLSTISNCIKSGINTTVAIVPSTTAHYLPDSLEKIIEYFLDMGVRSFSLEIPSIIMDEVKNTKFDSNSWYRILDLFFGLILPDFIYNEDKYLFNIPKEHYPGQFNKTPCSDNNIAISPKGNTYHCRDTAANEERLIANNKIEFFSNVKSIKEIERNKTCHVKVLQGYDSSSIIKGNELRTRMMYEAISLMNLYYHHLVNGNTASCDSSIKILTELSFYESLILRKK